MFSLDIVVYDLVESLGPYMYYIIHKWHNTHYVLNLHFRIVARALEISQDSLCNVWLEPGQPVQRGSQTKHRMFIAGGLISTYHPVTVQTVSGLFHVQRRNCQGIALSLAKFSDP